MQRTHNSSKVGSIPSARTFFQTSINVKVSVRTPLEDVGPTSKTLQKFLKKLVKAEVNSDLLKPLKDRFYSPPGYYSWNKHLTALSACTLLSELQKRKKLKAASPPEIAVEGLDADSAMSTMIALFAIASRGPARYISSNLMEVIWKTDPPKSIQVPELPLPSFHLFLPKNKLALPNGSFINTLTIVDNRLFSAYLNQYTDKRFDLDEDPCTFPGLRVLAVSTKTDICHAASLWQPIPGVFERKLDGFDKDYLDLGGQILGIAMNTVLAMIAEPELISIGELPPGVRPATGFGSGPTDGPSAPVWIGRNYRRPATPSTPGDGSGAPLKPHWRRGHWHQVCCGPERRERRVRWFKPVYVNA